MKEQLKRIDFLKTGLAAGAATILPGVVAASLLLGIES